MNKIILNVTKLIHRLTPLIFLVPPFYAHADDTLSFTSFMSGPNDDIATDVKGGILLAGGGEDVDEAMQWLVDQSGKGNALILRASGSDGYNQWLLDKGAHSVESIVFHRKSASYSNYVLNKVQNAELIFFAGGDQSNYVNYWKGTPLSDLISRKIMAGTPVGGTSAGLAILAEFIYSAKYESAQSNEVLQNPYHKDITMERNFFRIDLLKGLVTDSHFSERNRLGRLTVFMARLAKEGWSPLPKGIGVDEDTAVALDLNGTARLYGNGSAYLLRATSENLVCEPGMPLTYQDISVFKMNKQSTFDFNDFTGKDGVNYTLSVVNGDLKPQP